MSDSSAITILYVDDNESRRYWITRMLSRAGFHVEGTDSGVEALRLAIELRPAAVVIDVRLPDMSGVEVARKLRENPATQGLPILQISATYIGATDRVRGLEAGADAYLTEPFENLELLATLRSLLRMRAAEREAGLNRERLELAQRAGRIGSFEYDLQTGAIQWSKELEALYGLQPGTFEGTYAAWAKRVHPSDLRAVEDALRAAILNSTEFNHEFRVVWPDGSVHWLGARSQILKDEQGRAQRILGVNVDVTDRRRAEELARASFERLQQAHAAARIGAYEWDLETGKMHWSIPIPALTELSSSHDFDDWIRLVHPDDRGRVKAAFAEMFVDHREHEVECRILAPKRRTLWIYCKGHLTFNDDGTPTHVIGVAIDITERKLSEELLRRADKLTAAGSMAAVISHEINNPMEALTNLLYLISQNPTLDMTGKQFAEQGQRELLRMAHITRQMLAFYRESSKPILVSLREVLEDVIGIYGPKFQSRNVLVEGEFEGSCEIRGFPGELRQLFTNLLGNAFEISPTDSLIRVRVHPVFDRQMKEERGFSVLISDHGPGIARQNYEKIFEPFFTTKGENGTGLGLWVSHGIVRKHGGSIRFRSSTNPARSGTCFSVFLPKKMGSLDEKKQDTYTLVAAS